MNTNFFRTLADMIAYICDIRWHEVPYHIAIVAVSAGVAYCASMVLIGFPVAIWESLSKKKVNAEKEAKVIKAVTILFAVLFIYRLLYEKVT